MELKEVIKAAILEAFAEMYGVATLEDTDDSAPEDGEGSENNSGGIGNNVGAGANSGGTPSGDGYALTDGTPLKLSEKDEKWEGIKANVFKN